MKLKSGKSEVSRIYQVGQFIRESELKSDEKFLKLNQGVNNVVHPDIKKIINNLDFGIRPFAYPPNDGYGDLKEAINQEFFFGTADLNNIVITPGSVGALDIIMQLIDSRNIYLPEFFWGPYKIIAENRRLSPKYYKSYDTNLKPGDSIIICDPNNPTGVKLDDDKLYDWILELTKKDIFVIFDSPYRRLFKDRTDDLFYKLMNLQNLVIVESFSKSLSLPGMRCGFIHSKEPNLVKEFRTRLLYTAGGVSAMTQLVVRDLLNTDIGKEEIAIFKAITTENINKNIDWLNEHNLVSKELYVSRPEGLFIIVNLDEKLLLDNYIGAVTLPFFTEIEENKEKYKDHSRICLSVKNEIFVKYFENLV
ncbi:MAG: pyridoxal phosphate-dependent aminotransferase [Candidatus Delongbacteria bacterium]|nr:pyridoxal phosphate-dependent aminotransferase [Candidatus Delongbacteria bacterium]MBN2833734.1 pyridoxal phosphate-dependent aminotransferase [Candidatus Delongbacteria bacterium]